MAEHDDIVVLTSDNGDIGLLVAASKNYDRITIQPATWAGAAGGLP